MRHVVGPFLVLASVACGKQYDFPIQVIDEEGRPLEAVVAEFKVYYDPGGGSSFVILCDETDADGLAEAEARSTIPFPMASRPAHYGLRLEKSGYLRIDTFITNADDEEELRYTMVACERVNEDCVSEVAPCTEEDFVSGG